MKLYGIEQQGLRAISMFFHWKVTIVRESMFENQDENKAVEFATFTNLNIVNCFFF